MKVDVIVYRRYWRDAPRDTAVDGYIKVTGDDNEEEGGRSKGRRVAGAVESGFGNGRRCVHDRSASLLDDLDLEVEQAEGEDVAICNYSGDPFGNRFKVLEGAV